MKTLEQIGKDLIGLQVGNTVDFMNAVIIAFDDYNVNGDREVHISDNLDEAYISTDNKSIHFITENGKIIDTLTY